MVCRDFILPEPASYVFFYALFNLRNLLYIIGLGDQIAVAVVDINGTVAVVIPYQGQKGYQLNTLIPLLLHFIWRSSMLL